MSVVRPMWVPPPTQYPCTCAMVGLENSHRFSVGLTNRSDCAFHG